MVGGTKLTGRSQLKSGNFGGYSSSSSGEASLFLAFLLLGCRKPSSALRFRAIRAGSASAFLNPGGTSGKRSHSAAAATAGPLATAAATVSGRLDAATNAGFGARLLVRRHAETLDSTVEDESAIFDLLASARWDRVKGRRWGGSDRSLHYREANGGVRDEGAAAVLYVLCGLGQSSTELNPLMSLARGPNHVLAHTWPTNQYTYVGQWSSLNGNLTAGPKFSLSEIKIYRRS